VRLAAAAGLLGGPAALGGRRASHAGEEALDGSRARQGAGVGPAGHGPAQLDEDASGAPAWAGGTQAEDARVPGEFGPLGLAAGGVAGEQGGVPQTRAACQEAGRGGGGQAEGAGDAGGRLALVGEAEDGGTDAESQGGRHDTTPNGKGDPFGVPPRPCRANLVSHFH
jgi:hypothetical protein